MQLHRQALSTLFLAAQALAQQPAPVDKTLKAFQHLPATGAPTCTPSPTPSATPSEYSCTLTQPKKKKTAGDEVSLFQDNDNTIALFYYGDDEGFTNAFGINYLHRMEKDKSVIFDVKSDLYTKGAKVNKNAKDVFGVDPVNMLDVEKFKATFQKGKEFYFKAALGFEIRSVGRKDGSKAPEAMIQNKWHQIFDLDTFEYVNPEGDPEKGVEPSEVFKNVSRSSLLVDAGAGKEIQVWEGRCQLKAEVNTSLSTEKQKMVGPNSNISVDGGTKVDLLRKRKDKSPLVTAGADATVMYFPTSYPGQSGNIGAKAKLSLTTSHSVGKNKGTLQPYISFTLPLGRQIFQPMNNDIDPIQRLGIRFIFPK